MSTELTNNEIGVQDPVLTNIWHLAFLSVDLQHHFPKSARLKISRSFTPKHQSVFGRQALHQLIQQVFSKSLHHHTKENHVAIFLEFTRLTLGSCRKKNSREVGLPTLNLRVTHPPRDTFLPFHIAKFVLNA